ncbi:MAG: hypothetical protein U9M89_02705 [Patescibacteria group bacterium]|nr:hypothetical protein [Patescibacteria group bacterium]
MIIKETTVLPGNKLEIQYGFIGKPIGWTEPGPGNPSLDPAHGTKIKKLLPITEPGVVLVPGSDHTGIIAFIERQFPVNELVDHRLRYWSGDSVVLKNAFSEGVINFLTVRVRDCVPIIGGTSDGTLFTAHLSNQTLFGYGDQTKFRGSILKDLFHLVDSSKCWLSIGPSAGGGGCKCYEYTETKGQLDASRLKNRINSEYPDFDVDPFITNGSNESKKAFLWGKLIHAILLYHEVDAKNINTSHNICTICNLDDWYSDRVMRDYPKDPATQIGASNFGYIAPYFKNQRAP